MCHKIAVMTPPAIKSVGGEMLSEEYREDIKQSKKKSLPTILRGVQHLGHFPSLKGFKTYL